MSDKIEAKALFLKYNGSKFYMQREGDLEKYKGYKITLEEEEKWVNEALNILYSKFDNDVIDLSIFSDICLFISSYKSERRLIVLFDKVKIKLDSEDSFTKVTVVGSLIELFRTYKRNEIGKNTIKEGLKFIKKQLKIVKKNPENIAKKYLEDEYLKGYLGRDEILERVKNAQKSIKEYF